MAQHIVVTDYNPEWERMFEEEARAFREILGDNCVDIQHIGSTAVPGLAAKPVIDIMPEQKDVQEMGGTMRLGQYPCVLNPESKSFALYQSSMIYERHRHRYEVNNDYRDELTAHGMMLAGTSPDNHIVEMIELPDHPWFVAAQFHPEFKSRPNRPHPLFRGFVTAAAKRHAAKEEKK